MNGLTEDYIETARQLNLCQFKTSPKLTALMSGFLLPYGSLQQVLSQLINERHLDTAVGKQLDGIGDIVGIARPYDLGQGLWYFGFTGQSKAKGFSQAPIRNDRLKLTASNYEYMSDQLYRRLLKWKIIANNSHGTVEDIIQSAIALYDATNVHVQTLNPCHFGVTITLSSKSKVEAFSDQPERFIPTATGVKVDVNFIYQ